MTRSSSPVLLTTLQHPADTSSQISALRVLKNQLIGHELRKKEWIGHGILPVLSSILLSRTKRTGKRSDRSQSGHARSLHRPEQISDEDSTMLQAISVLAVIAQGGPNFVRPILSTDVLSKLFLILNSTECHIKVACKILKCLNIIADRLPTPNDAQWLPDKQLAVTVYSPQNIGAIARIIGYETASATSQEASSLAISLVCKTCTDEAQKRALVQAGVLTALSAKLASFVVTQGLVLPGTENIIQEAPMARVIPPPAPPQARLGPLLEAIALLIEHSASRAEDFLTTPAITAVLPKAQADFCPTDVKRTPWGNVLSGSAVPRIRIANPIDVLLPFVPPQSATSSAEIANFPPLGSARPMSRRRSSMLVTNAVTPTEPPHDSSGEEDESPVIAWLIYLVRTQTGFTRLMSAKVLVALVNLGLTKKSRITPFCMIFVPILVRLLDRDSEDDEAAAIGGLDLIPPSLRVVEETPAVIAALIIDNPELQKAAVEAHAIRRLCLALKSTFEPAPDRAIAMWSPDKSSKASVGKTTPDRSLGPKGPTHTARHIMRYRETILQALASIAPFDDEYRSAICDAGVMPCIIDSLKPFGPTGQTSPADSRGMTTITGNPASVLLAACGVTRALTRSVSHLRTNLIDAGIATPILKLLGNADPEIKIAATKVISNLAMDFSPMKDTISTQNIVKVLCEQTHSANPKLRLESIWALKHLVLKSNNELRIAVIQELGPNWIKLLISTDPADIPEGVVIGLVDMDFAPRSQFRPSSALSDDMEGVVMGSDEEAQFLQRNGLGYQSSGYAWNNDLDPNKHTAEDDTRIQAQLLDLLRNLICGERDRTAEIIDYLFREMGQRDFFDIMLTRLRPRTVIGATRKDNKTIPPPADIVLKVLHVLVHIVASLARFRNMVAANSSLLRQVLTYTNHVNSKIRAQCCWIAINLTYEDEPSDRMGCKHRALELQKVGYFTKLMALSNDEDLDVRERTKTAIHLSRSLLSS